MAGCMEGRAGGMLRDLRFLCYASNEARVALWLADNNNTRTHPYNIVTSFKPAKR